MSALLLLPPRNTPSKHLFSHQHQSSQKPVEALFDFTAFHRDYNGNPTHTTGTRTHTRTAYTYVVLIRGILYVWPTDYIIAILEIQFKAVIRLDFVRPEVGPPPKFKILLKDAHDTTATTDRDRRNRTEYLRFLKWIGFLRGVRSGISGARHARRRLLYSTWALESGEVGRTERDIQCRRYRGACQVRIQQEAEAILILS